MVENMTKRPNIVFIISDDTDFSMLGYSGGRVLTPNIDRLADEGVQCTQYYTSTPVCTPARYNCLTGHYAGRCPTYEEAFPEGEPYTVTWNTDLLPERELCIGQALQRGGYLTGFVGKWHCGPGERKLGIMPFERDDDPADPDIARRLRLRQAVLQEQVRGNGFDYAAAVHWGNTDGRDIGVLQEHNLEWTCQGALDFLDQYGQGDQPFFLHVGTTTIHGPSHVKSLKSDVRLTGAGYQDDHVGCMPPRESVLERVEEAEGIELNHRTAGALWMDDCVGAIADKVDELGLADDTIFIYTTDHNIFDGKATCYQGGVHIPFVMRWPGRVPEGRVCGEMWQNIDLLPTLLGTCEVEVPEEMVVDGRNVLPALTGEGPGAPDREELYLEWGYTRAVVTEKWKYIAFRYPDRLIEEMKSGETDVAYDMAGRTGSILQIRRYPHYWDPDQLYDLEADPEEQNNLACDEEYAEVLEDMRERLRGYLELFDRPFDLSEPDEFVFSDKYEELKEASGQVDPNQWEWFRKGWY
jgi:arylsulfatase A-like enzyme